MRSNKESKFGQEGKGRSAVLPDVQSILNQRKVFFSSGNFT